MRDFCEVGQLLNETGKCTYNPGRLALLVQMVLIAVTLQACRDVGFRDLDNVRHNASVTTAKSVMESVQSGLKAYKEVNHTYPVTTEQDLYDSIRNYMTQPVDPAYLYRNDNGRGYYIGIGGRNNRLVYRYPASIGPLDYTLYWVGPNGVNEEGEGDDVFPRMDTAITRIQRQVFKDVRADGIPLEFRVVRTGRDLFKDSVLLIIAEHDSVLYRDDWPLTNYFIDRPELTEVERRRIVREEFDKLLAPTQFVRTDSLSQHDWRNWVDFSPTSLEGTEIVKRNELMFNYYKGTEGSRGIVWSPIRKKFIVVWRSGGQK